MSELTNNLPNPDFDLKQRIVQDSVDMNPIDTSVPYQSIDDILPPLENPIDEHSSFLDMVNGLFEYYIDKLYTFDSGYYYPDHRKVEEHFNYMVKEN